MKAEVDVVAGVVKSWRSCGVVMAYLWCSCGCNANECKGLMYGLMLSAVLEISSTLYITGDLKIDL